jgi:uncharacterized protein YjdB
MKTKYQGDDIKFDIPFDANTFNNVSAFTEYSSIDVYAYTNGCIVAKFSSDAKDGYETITITSTNISGVIDSLYTSLFAPGTLTIEVRTSKDSNEVLDKIFNIIKKIFYCIIRKSIIKKEGSGGLPQRILSINPSTFNISATDANEYSTVVTSTVDGSSASWSAVSNQDWCTLTQSSGINSDKLKFKLSENISLSSRSAIITITQYGGASITLVVNQSAKNYINVTSIDFQITNDSSTKYVGAQEIAVATITPSNATNKSVIWTSSNNNIAEIDISTGAVKWLLPGSVQITCTSSDNTAIKKTKEYQVKNATDFRASQYVVSPDSDGTDLNKKITITSYQLDTFLPFTFRDVPDWLSIVQDSSNVGQTLGVTFSAAASETFQSAIVTAVQNTTGATLSFTVAMSADTFTFKFLDPNDEEYNGDAREIIIQVTSTNSSGKLSYAYKNIFGDFLQFYMIDSDNNIRFRMSEYTYDPINDGTDDPILAPTRSNIIELTQEVSGKKITKTITQQAKFDETNVFMSDLGLLTFNTNQIGPQYSKAITISSNVNNQPALWEVQSYPDWISFADGKMSGSDKDYIQPYVNREIDSNVIASITLARQLDLKEISITVSLIISDDNYVFSISPNAIDLPANENAEGVGNGININVDSQLNGNSQRWLPAVSAPWLKIKGGVYDSIATLYWDANTAIQRKGYVTFKQYARDGETVYNIKRLPITQLASSSAIAVTGINVSSSALSFTSIGTIQNIGASVSPSNATNRNILYTSSNNNICTVDANGNVTSVSNGEATITCRTEESGYIKYCSVTVNSAASEYVFESPISDLYFDSSGTTQNTQIISTHNGAYSNFVTHSAPDWLLSVQRDYDDETLQTHKVTLSQNTTGNMRSGDWALRQVASGKLLIIKLYQYA